MIIFAIENDNLVKERRTPIWVRGTTFTSCFTTWNLDDEAELLNYQLKFFPSQVTVNVLLLLCLLLLQHLECDCRKQELFNSLVTPVETLWEWSGKMIRNKERKTEKAAEMARLQKYRVEVAVHRLNRQSISISKPLWSSAMPESLLKSQISGPTVRI